MLLLFSVACSSKLKPPVEFRFKDENIEAVATFSKFSKSDSRFFGKMSIRNTSLDKRVMIDTSYLERGKIFTKIEPDYVVDLIINIGKLGESRYDITTKCDCSADELRNFIMNIGYTLQNDTIPNYRLSIR